MAANVDYSYTSSFRGGQGWLRHQSYLRLSKVYFLLQLLEQAGLSINKGDIFDYGFGAGTFFRFCGQHCRLFGVEVDPRAVAQVTQMLNARRRRCELDVVNPASWRSHPLLARTYDVIICSHVLEHLEDPVDLLDGLRRCLKPRGAIVAIVPINELRHNPQHIQSVSRGVVEKWTRRSGLQLLHYAQGDALSYPIQPLFSDDRGWRHLCAQAVSIGLGLVTALAGQRLWTITSDALEGVAGLKPGQAGFVLSRSSTEPA